MRRPFHKVSTPSRTGPMGYPCAPGQAQNRTLGPGGFFRLSSDQPAPFVTFPGCIGDRQQLLIGSSSRPREVDSPTFADSVIAAEFLLGQKIRPYGTSDSIPYLTATDSNHSTQAVPLQLLRS